MKNLAFVIWMLGWVYLINAYPSPNEGYSKTDKGIVAMVELVLWVVIGILLYEK